MPPQILQDKQILSQLNPPPFQENLLAQPEDEEKLLRILLSSVKAGRRYRGQYATNWTDYTRKMAGDFYRNKQRFGFECRPNKYLEKVELQANLLTQEPFKDYVVRADQSNDPNDAKPEIFARIMKDIKKVCKYDSKEYTGLLMAGMYGPLIFKIFWNKDLSNGRGYGDVLEIDPRCFVISPGAKDIDDAQFVAYSRPVATSELKRLYPALRDKIKSDPGISTNDLYGQDISENAGYAVSDARTGAVAYLDILKNQQNMGKAGDQSMLHEFYYRDPRWLTLNSEEDLRKWVYARPGFGNPYFMDREIQERLVNGFPQQVPLYPHGRLIFFTDGVKLEDHPNPYRRFPFRVWKNHIQPHVFWPKGQIELISEPFSNYHVISSSLAANWVYRAQPPFATDDQSMDDNKYKTIKPNTLIKVGAGRTLKPLEIPPLPVQEAQAILNIREGEADSVSGVSSLLSGSRPQGVFAGSYFNSLQDSAFKTFSTLVKRMREFRIGVGEDFLWMIQNYLTDERIIPFVNEDDQQQLMTVNQLSAETSGPQLNVVRRNNLGVGQFLYFIEEGSDQPYNLISRQSQANQLAEVLLQAGYEIPAFELLLGASGIPGSKRILRQVQQQYQQKIQMAGQQKSEQMSIMSQQRADQINQEMAKLSAKIEAARLQSGAKVQAAHIAHSPQAQNIMEDQNVDPNELQNILQATAARLMQEGMPPDHIVQMIQGMGQSVGMPAGDGMGPGMGMPGNAQFPMVSNLDPQTPQIPLQPGAPPMVPPMMPQGGPNV